VPNRRALGVRRHHGDLAKTLQLVVKRMESR